MKIMGCIVYALSFIYSLMACQRADKGGQTTEKRIVRKDTVAPKKVVKPVEVLDSVAYKAKIIYMLNGDSTGKWFKNGPYPLPGAILPNKRVVAYYGNLYSTRMGILGELPKP